MVTILMPVYNTPLKYLRSSVESILHQSYNNYEFIIIDESNDNNVINYLGEVCDEDKRVRYYHFNKGYGYINCLNYGIEKSKGEYIARMDADDIANHMRIEKQVKYFKDNPSISILGSAVTLINENGKTLSKRIYPNTDRKIKKQLHIWNPICHSSVMFRATLVKEIGVYSNNVEIEDYDLWFRAKKYGANFANLTEPLINYRIFEKKKEFNRGRHWGNNIKLKAKYFSIKSLIPSLMGLIIITVLFIIPPKGQNKLYYYFNLWR
jgi:glycosyltransferase involved in cell wall biosynthesis